MIERYASAWREALLLPGETDLIESGLAELAEYFGISRSEARRTCESSLEDSRREWESSERRTAEQIVAFYQCTRSYLFEHIWWHTTDVVTNSSNVAILEYAKRCGAREYLDFGSGVGSNAILFASQGFNVSLADVSRTMLDFARWRIERRGIKAEYIDLNHQSLPRNRFDFITAVDVCEHLAAPSRELKHISRALMPGGSFVFNYRAGIDEERPMHILSSSAPVLRSIRQNGFREAGSEADRLRRLEFCVLQLISRSRIEDFVYSVYDHARYTRLFMSSKAFDSRWEDRRTPHPQRVFFKRVQNSLGSASCWLDLGCGRQIVPWWMKGNGELEAELKSHTHCLIGVDRDFQPLDENRSCKARLNADAGHLPFADRSFDLVTCNMVLEYIADPRRVLGEIRRVLRPGGRLIAITPNWLDIMTIATRSVPQGLQEKLAPRTESHIEGNSSKPHYRFNRPATIESFLKEAGFNRRRIEQLDQPDTYAHVPILARIESIWHQMAKRWSFLRGTILIEAE